MSAAWVGLIGTALGAVIGALTAVLVGFHEQQRAPKLQVLDRVIQAHAKIYGSLFAVGESVKRREKPEVTIARIEDFKNDLVANLIFLDAKKTRPMVLDVYNYLMSCLDAGEVNTETFQGFLDSAQPALLSGVGLKFI